MEKTRKCGLIFGLAAGDLNGGPIQMARIVCQSVIERKGFEKSDIFHRYLKWFQNREEGFDDTGQIGLYMFGKLKIKDYEELENKNEWIDKTVKELDVQLKGMTAGVNPAHRNSVLCLFGFSDEELFNNIKNESTLTHFNPFSTETAYIVAKVCEGFIQGKKLEEVCEVLETHRTHTFTELAQKAIEVMKIMDLKVLESKRPKFESGFSPQTLFNAMYFVRKYTLLIRNGVISDHSEAFEKCLKEGFLFSSSNYTPVLVGSMLGSKLGKTAINESMLKHCKCLKDLEEICNHLCRNFRQ